jgi:hypothetical protein
MPQRLCCEWFDHGLAGYTFRVDFLQGYGDNVPVTVKVGGRVSNAIPFAYDPPFISSIVPSTPDANGATIAFRGASELLRGCV